MPLNNSRSSATADAVADVANQVATIHSLIQQLLEFNSDQAIDWGAGSTPSYITEDEDGNLTGKQFSRQDVSNVIGSLDWIRKLLTNQSMIGSQGDHLGNINKLVRPLG